MATVLESLAIPRSSPLPRPTLSPITASSSSISHRPLKFPQAHGLKLNFTSTLLSSVLHSKFSCGARIICEAQDTVVEASWRSPCRIIHPVIDELAKLYTKMLKCYKVNTDECKNIPTEYGIQSIPTVLVFKGGEKKDAVIGAVPKTTLINLSFLENNVENYLFNNSMDFQE